MRSHSECGMMRGIRSNGKQALGAAPVAVDRERDSLNEERKIGQLAALLELRGSHRGQLLEQLGVLRARIPGRGEHLVVKTSRVVALKQAELRHVRRSGSHWRTLSVNVVWFVRKNLWNPSAISS